MLRTHLWTCTTAVLINREISRKRQEFGMDAYDISYSGVDYTKKTGSETTDGE